MGGPCHLVAWSLCESVSIPPLLNIRWALALCRARCWQSGEQAQRQKTPEAEPSQWHNDKSFTCIREPSGLPSEPQVGAWW